MVQPHRVSDAVVSGFATAVYVAWGSAPARGEAQ